MASSLPDFFVKPDMGPKMYNAYGEQLFNREVCASHITTTVLCGPQGPLPIPAVVPLTYILIYLMPLMSW